MNRCWAILIEENGSILRKKNVSGCHFVRHKSHTDWSGNEPGHGEKKWLEIVWLRLGIGSRLNVMGVKTLDKLQRIWLFEQIRTSIRGPVLWHGATVHRLCSHALWLYFNPLNAELNPIRHLLALVGARHIVHVSRVTVNVVIFSFPKRPGHRGSFPMVKR